MEWTAATSLEGEYTYSTGFFLKLPSRCRQGMSYTVTAGAATNGETSPLRLGDLRLYNTRSEALHVNLVG
jgi:hypothetical protein